MFSRPRIILALVLALLAPRLEARIILNGYDAFPLDCTSREDAVKLMRERMGDELYNQLDSSQKSYFIAFQEAEEIVEETGHRPEFVRDKLTGYLEKELNGKNSYTLHINTTWIANHLDARLAQPDLQAKSEEERALWRVRKGRLLACGILAHEGTHAAELERGELDFSSKVIGKSIHVKIAMDKYDEYFAHVAQYKALEVEGDLEAQAKKDVDASYKHLKPKFLIVKNGKEDEGTAPFPWPGATDAKRTAPSNRSFGQFVAEAAALGEPATTEAGKKPKKPRGKGRSESPDEIELDLAAINFSCGEAGQECGAGSEEIEGGQVDAKSSGAGAR